MKNKELIQALRQELFSLEQAYDYLSDHDLDRMELIQELLKIRDNRGHLIIKEQLQGRFALHGYLIPDLKRLYLRPIINPIIGEIYTEYQLILTHEGFAHLIEISPYRVRGAHHDFINKKAALVD